MYAERNSSQNKHISYFTLALSITEGNVKKIYGHLKPNLTIFHSHKKILFHANTYLVDMYLLIF